MLIKDQIFSSTRCGSDGKCLGKMFAFKIPACYEFLLELKCRFPGKKYPAHPH